jgi:hypothetical protein
MLEQPTDVVACEFSDADGNLGDPNSGVWVTQRSGKTGHTLLRNDRVQKFLDNAGVVGVYVPVATTHKRLSKMQFIAQLKIAGKVSQAKAAYALWAEDDDAKLQWEMAPWIDYDGALAQQLKADLGYTDQQLQNFFDAAGEL